MKKLAIIVSDLVALYGALFLVLLVRYEPSELMRQYGLHAKPFSMVFLAWFFSFYIANLYEERTLRNGRDFYERLGQAMVIAASLSFAFFYLLPLFVITPKTNLFLFVVFATALAAGVRWVFNRILAGGSKRPLLLVGVNDESLELAEFITDNPQFGYIISGILRLGQESLQNEDSKRWSIIDNLADIESFIRREHIDTVVISPKAYRMDEVIEIFYGTLSEHVDFADLATFTEQLTGTVPLGAINQSWFLDNMTEGSKKSYEVFKRGVDIISAILLGIPTLAITPFVAFAIKATSRGPLLFRQRRTGRAGKPFSIIKFRTMRRDAEKSTGAVWAKMDDPRVTRVGKFLRKTRIDELPQLWNILVGQMSLVGPRAERPEIDEQLGVQIPFYRQRYLIKPGLSGWAQINYPYGASVADAMHKLQYDLYYTKHRTLALDLEIILKTINISLRRAGR